MKNLFSWAIHGDGKTLHPGEVVEPDERLTWGRTAGIGAQHVVAMFGATFLVPILTGFDPSTTLFFTAMSTALFLLINKNVLPSYLGSSFGFIAQDGGEGDVFVHYSEIEGRGFRTLEENQRVEFEVGQGQKGPQAQRV